MQWKIFEKYIGNIIHEGNRLQKLDIDGEKKTERKFTQLQILTGVLSVIAVYFLPQGFPGDFVRDIVVFLGIFIGLFAGIVVSLHDRSKELFLDFQNKLESNGTRIITETEKARIMVIRNYLVQFTGLTAYAILMALVLIILLLLTLLYPVFQTNIFDYQLCLHKIDIYSCIRFVLLSLLEIHRLLILYFLLNFFIITIYSITSYFSYLLNYYNQIKPKND